MVRFISRAVFALAAATLLVACGGSGSSGTSITSVSQVGSSEGSVTLLVGDGPIDDYDQAVFEISQIYLLSDDERSEPLLQEPATVDLLELENLSELLVDAVSVPAGTYEKIRLEITSITLHKTDDDDQIIPGESLDVDVPASGRIDLNPRGSFTITEGDSLALELDIDLDGSVRARNNGALRFRPVVFIDQIDDNYRGRNSRMHGVIRTLDAEAGTLQLCNARRLSNDDDSEQLAKCIDVTTAERTLYVNSIGEEITFAALAEGEEATIFGRYRQRSVIAAVIAVGERGTFRNLEGEVAGAPSESGSFPVTVDDLKGVEEDSDITVVLAENARIFSDDDDNSTAGVEDLLPGVEIEARGVLSERTETGLVFTAFFLHIESDDDGDTDDSDEDVEFAGLIEAIDLEAGTLSVVDAQQVTRCVLVNDDTDVVRVSDSEEATESTEGSLQNLQVGGEVEIAGEMEEGSDCVEAEDILIVGVSGVE